MSGKSPVNESHDWHDEGRCTYNESAMECRCRKCGAFAYRDVNKDTHWIPASCGYPITPCISCDEVLRRDEEMKEIGMSYKAHQTIYYGYRNDGRQAESWLDCIENFNHDDPMLDTLKQFKDDDLEKLLDLLEFSECIKPPKPMVKIPRGNYVNPEKEIWMTYLVHKIRDRRHHGRKDDRETRLQPGR